MHGSQVENVLGQPPLRTETQSQPGTDEQCDSDTVVEVMCVRNPHQGTVESQRAGYTNTTEHDKHSKLNASDNVVNWC